MNLFCMSTEFQRRVPPKIIQRDERFRPRFWQVFKNIRLTLSFFVRVEAVPIGKEARYTLSEALPSIELSKKLY